MYHNWYIVFYPPVWDPSLAKMTVVGRSTDQVSNQVTDQDKTPIDRLLAVLGNEELSAAEIRNQKYRKTK